MTLRIQQVDGRSGTARFVDVSWKVHDRESSAWVPPLRAVVRGALDRVKNPFYQSAERGLFIAERAVILSAGSRRYGMVGITNIMKIGLASLVSLSVGMTKKQPMRSWRELDSGCEKEVSRQREAR
ncbi:MAG: hypothetical protein CM1200mP14_00550 [Gammaproteobacteria bacterium]|nr:MAG: hypothetical protein CM1200mP14_00550 [Gammaproteobacteria bacterium]